MLRVEAFEQIRRSEGKEDTGISKPPCISAGRGKTEQGVEPSSWFSCLKGCPLELLAPNLADKVDRKRAYASGIWETAEAATLTFIPAAMS